MLDPLVVLRWDTELYLSMRHEFLKSSTVVMELKLSVILWKLDRGICRILAQIQRIAKLWETMAIWSSFVWVCCMFSNDFQDRSLKLIRDSPFGILTKDGSSLHWFQTSGQLLRISLPVIPSNEPRFNSMKPESCLIGTPVIDDI